MNSQMFLKLLEVVLKTGNKMNVGTNRGDHQLARVHYNCDSNTSSGNPSSLQDDVQFRKIWLQVVARLSSEMGNVKKAVVMDSDVLSIYVSKLAGGVGKISEVLRLNKSAKMLSSSSERFSLSMNDFLKEEEIISLLLLKETTEHFHGNPAKEEAHPFLSHFS